MQYPERGTVRWYVSEYVRRHLADTRPPYLEIGSRHEDWQWWVDLRAQNGIRAADWTGLDMQPGPNVDRVLDLVNQAFSLPAEMKGAYHTVVCAEVLEHVTRPSYALHSIEQMLAPGGKLIITVPFAFPIHNFPDDYWRYTPSGLRLLLTEAGFVDIETDLLNVQKIELRDHDERVFQRELPMHIGAVARKPE